MENLARQIRTVTMAHYTELSQKVILILMWEDQICDLMCVTVYIAYCIEHHS